MAEIQHRIGVVGAGTMGAGIALVALYAGYEVYVHDAFPQMLDKAGEYIKNFLNKKGQGARYGQLHLGSDLVGLAPATVVIEAAPEKLELKQDVFRQLECILAPDAILATNTSTLSVTAIAAATQRPERVAGLHFFNPAPVLPLVEIVRAARTGESTIEKLVHLAQRLGKTPVITGDTPGFIVNRVARPFYGEALRLLGEGVATYEQIDAIVERGAGFKMGPFRLMDLIGIDINAGAMRSMYEQSFGEPRYRPHWIQTQKVAEGALGRKSGRGFYEYKDEGGRMKDEKEETNKQVNQVLGKGKDEGGRMKDEKEETRKQVNKVASGKILISEGSWAPGLAELCTKSGYVVDSVAGADERPMACFVVAGRQEDAARLATWYDEILLPEVPIFVQGGDIAFSEAKTWVQQPERIFGFDGLFAAGGSVLTLVGDGPRESASRVIETLGLEPMWVGESPALVLPRIVCQLVNEAAFAQLEGVAEGETIDLAMRLGVNYPHGPLEWGRTIGYDKVLAVLDHLYGQYHEERYRACVAIRRWASHKS